MIVVIVAFLIRIVLLEKHLLDSGKWIMSLCVYIYM